MRPGSSEARKLERELEGDRRYLRRKAVRLIDQVAITQGQLTTISCRLWKLKGSCYYVPDGRTK